MLLKVSVITLAAGAKHVRYDPASVALSVLCSPPAQNGVLRSRQDFGWIFSRGHLITVRSNLRCISATRSPTTADRKERRDVSSTGFPEIATNSNKQTRRGCF